MINDEEHPDDEFNEDAFDNEETFDDFDDGKETTLADAIRDNPIVKIGIIIGVLLLIYLIFVFLRPDEDVAPSSLPNPSEVNVAPGTQEIPDNIRAAIEESDEQRRELAEQTGQSALPTLIEPPSQQLDLERNDLGEEDPLQRWRALQQERLKKEQNDVRFVDQDGDETAFTPEDLRALADAMAAQMQAILENKSDPVYQAIDITPASYIDIIKAAQAEEAARELAAGRAGDSFDPSSTTPLTNALTAETTPDGTNAEDVEIVEILVPAGDIEYAQLLLEANSHIPGPVLARIAGGPLSGSKLLGSFTVQREHLTLTFNTLVREGISQPINAIAIDPGTSLTGMATEVDHRYFTRVILPAAAAFIEGAAEAIAASGQTTITVSGTSTTSTTSDTNTDTDEEISAGIEEAAEKVSEILDEKADNTETLVRIHAGTPIGLLFLEPVLKE